MSRARGPRKKVTDNRELAGERWLLTLECGHEAIRPVKRRRGSSGLKVVGSWANLQWGSVIDPAPIWVYCNKCVED